MSATKEKPVRHVPGITTDRNDEWLAEKWLPLGERVDRPLGGNQRLLCGDRRPEGVDVDSAQVMLAMAEKDGSPQRRIMFIVVVRVRERQEGRQVDAVVNLRPIESQQRHLPAAFDGERGAARERNFGQMRPPWSALGRSCRR